MSVLAARFVEVSRVADVTRALSRAQQALAFVEGLSLDDEAAFKRAESGYQREVRAELEEQTAQRDSYLDPAKLLAKRIKDDFDPQIATLKRALDLLKAKCVGYRQRVEGERAARQLEAQRAIATQAPPEVVRAALVAVAETVAPKTAGVSYVDHWVAEVKDPTQVPEKYWVRIIDHAAIAADVKAGAREIPGVQIENRPFMRDVGARR